jgi:signal transduction histidine kinase
LQQTGQLERGNVQLHRESCDISVLVQNAVTEAQGLENRRSIEMDVQVGDAAVLAAVDARWLSVAVFELTSNAIRHATQRVQVKLTADEREIVISVTDDNRAHVDFAPARWKFTREARGLGLALAIVREVAEEHGGTLEIGCRDRSGLTTGSEVCLRLPREAQAEGGEARRLRS